LRKFVVFTIVPGLVLIALLGSTKTLNATDQLCTGYLGLPSEGGDKAGMVFIPGGSFTMGSDRERPEERFTHIVQVDGFWIDQHEVTNAEFERFVKATGYITLAERGVDPTTHPGMSQDMLAPGSVVFIRPTELSRGGDLTQWWQYVKGADWRHPDGPGSSIEGKQNYPVVNVAYEDALAYAHWRGHELPSEAQWEFAARGGHNTDEAWSDAFDKDGKPIANSWQGIFPVYNTEEDGYARAAPVGCFKPNDYGLYDMIGNVWEWTSDWYVPGHSREPATNPSGPSLMQVKAAADSRQARSSRAAHICAHPIFAHAIGPPRDSHRKWIWARVISAFGPCKNLSRQPRQGRLRMSAYGT
jgi:sulfatase modifying factor 1